MVSAAVMSSDSVFAEMNVSLYSGCSKLLPLLLSSLRKPHDDGISEGKAPTLALIRRSAKMPCKFDPTGSNTPLPGIECSNRSESPCLS